MGEGDGGPQGREGHRNVCVHACVCREGGRCGENVCLCDTHEMMTAVESLWGVNVSVACRGGDLHPAKCRGCHQTAGESDFNWIQSQI